MRLATLILLATSWYGYSQIEFRAGYYIDSHGNRSDGFIKDADWENNPTSFTFQRNAAEEPRHVTIGQAKEFGIDGVARYVKASVNIDKSSESLSHLSTSKAPDFKHETVFLKVILSGRASLYLHVGAGIEKYFLETDKVPLEQLVFKTYLQQVDVIHKNMTFRQQLRNALVCDEPKLAAFERAEYTRHDLTDLVRQYNACVGTDVIEYTSHQDRDLFKLWLRPRVALSSLSADRTNAPSDRHFQFDKKFSFGAGVEMEFTLPFNRNKWAFILEPTYQAYSTVIASEPIRVDYKSIDVPVGVRHYFFLNDRSKLSLAAAYQMNFDLNSQIVHKTNIELEVHMSSNMAFEIGYILNDRLCIAYRIQTPRELLGLYSFWNAKFNSMALVLGYSLF